MLFCQPFKSRAKLLLSKVKTNSYFVDEIVKTSLLSKELSSIPGMSVSTPLPIHQRSRTSPACIKRRPEVHCLRLPSQRYRRRHRRPFRCGKGVIFNSHLKKIYLSTRNNQVGNIIARYLCALFYVRSKCFWRACVPTSPARK